MTLDEAIRRNPYEPKRGNEAAYCRYLRYNVDGWYQFDSKEVRRRWQKVRNMSKSILTIDTPKGCMFCPIVKMNGFSAYHNYTPKHETVMDRQPYLGFTCPFCNGLRYVYDLRAEEVLTYKFEDCPLKEAEETQS